jgi:hypothetical protein
MAYLNNRWLLVTLAAAASVFLGVLSGEDDLVASLSERARVLYPNTENFTAASSRWSRAKSPSYSLIVQVATEADVQKTVSLWLQDFDGGTDSLEIIYANEKRVPFLAVSGGHGTTSELANAKDAIGIRFNQMRNITIVDDGQAVLIEGGVRTGDLLPYLWTRGKQTMTTACDCVGFIAPVIGGGHGWLQGRYGLATDQLLSARLVLANGTVVEVSQESNPDLFWALRGAGHNFGLVTQAKLKIYDVAPDEKQWIGSGLTFTHDKLEDLFDIGNKVLDDPERLSGLSYYFVFGFNPEVDPVNVSLFCHFAIERVVAHETSLSSHSGS